MNEIARRAFYNCATITEITIPASIETIGTQVFFKADNLHTVYYNSSYGDSDNPFFSQSSVEKIVFGGRSVPEYILLDRSIAVYVVISDSVTDIYEGAFMGCTGLTSVTLGNGVTDIGWSAFKGCTGLTSIVVPDSVTSIGKGAFYDCTGLTSIEIPDSVTSIGDEAFYNCTGLTSISFKGTVAQWKEIVKYWDYYWDYNINTVTCADGTVSLK